MMRNYKNLLVLATSAAATSRDGATPIEKVTSMLTDLIDEGTVELKKDEVQHSKKMTWCEGQQNLIQARIDEDSKLMNRFYAEMESQKAKARAQRDLNAKTTTKLDNLNKNIAKLSQIRKHEKDIFSTTQIDLMESVSALERVLEVLSKAGEEATTAALLQAGGPKLADEVRAMLLQTSSTESPVQSQKYTMKSNTGGAQAMCTQMLEKFEGELQSARTEESTREDNYELSLQSLTQEKENAERVIKRSGKKAGDHAKKAGELKGKVNERVAANNDSSALLGETKQGCKRAEKEYPERMAVRRDEIAALTQAKEIVSGKPTQYSGKVNEDRMGNKKQLGISGGISFVQLKSDNDRMARVAKIFKRNGVTSLLNLVSKVQAGEGQFDQIISTVRDMIERLQNESKQEQEQHGWCTAQLSVNNIEIDDATDRKASSNQEVEDLNSDISELKDNIKSNTNEISELQTSLAEATEERLEQKANNQQTVKEAVEAQEAVSNAITVLQNFYDNNPSPPGPGGSDTGSKASGVVAMMELIQSDFSRLESNTQADEAEQSDTYAKYKQDSKISVAQKTAMNENAQRSMANKKSNLIEAKADFKSSSEALKKAEEVQETLRPTCIDTGVSHEERQAGRQQEIDQLGEALEILSAQ